MSTKKNTVKPEIAKSIKKNVLPTSVKHSRPSVVKPTETDLKWCAAFCALRNVVFDMSCAISQVACESYNLADNADRVMTKSALRDYLHSLNHRLQSIQSGMAGVVNAAEDYVGRDMIRECGVKFMEIRQKECADCSRASDERYLHHLAKKLGKKVL